ncbi:MAG: rhodanese-like domain-containing protein [Gammaproteobacteria bacterium]
MKIKNIFRKSYFITGFILLLGTFSHSHADSDYPGREIYPNIPTLSTEQLYQQFDNSIIIDARSSYEYETLRIKNAINIPLGLNNENFIQRIKKIREHSNQAIVFYCNGHSCMKSYKAARKAIIYAKANNVYAYDSGIFDWTRAHPEHAELLGKSPVKPEQLISKNSFKKHSLPALNFIKNANEKTIILDIRDRAQRDGFYIFSGYEHSIPLNNKKSIKSILLQAKKSRTPLYIYDATGKQVRWLQYYLESENVKEYYFMEGGAQAFFSIPVEELMDS